MYVNSFWLQPFCFALGIQVPSQKVLGVWFLEGSSTFWGGTTGAIGLAGAKRSAKSSCCRWGVVSSTTLSRTAAEFGKKAPFTAPGEPHWIVAPRGIAGPGMGKDRESREHLVEFHDIS